MLGGSVVGEKYDNEDVVNGRTDVVDVLEGSRSAVASEFSMGGSSCTGVLEGSVVGDKCGGEDVVNGSTDVVEVLEGSTCTVEVDVDDDFVINIEKLTERGIFLLVIPFTEKVE